MKHDLILQAMQRNEYPVELINALMAPGCGWGVHTARQEHTDHFGDTVRSDEDYFTRKTGGGYHHVMKLSSRSMVLFLEAIFVANERTRGLALHFIEQADRDRDEMMLRLEAKRAKPEAPKV